MAKRSVALLAGDAGLQRARIRRMLARLGCSVKTVDPTSELLCAVRQSKPDVILLARVRGHPGRAALCRLLKEDARARAVPVLALLDAHPSPAEWSQVVLADEVIRVPATGPEMRRRVQALLRLTRLVRDHQRAIRLVRRQSRLDDLTGLATHGAFKERIEREVLRATRYRRPLSVLMLDVDHFKTYNDAFGHPAGDRLLRLVGRLVTRELRQVDFAARYGGDEFSVVLPETTKAAAGVVAERIRASIRNHPFPHGHAQPLGAVTLSIGVATCPDDAPAADKLVAAADRALYQAKGDGRNLVRGLEGAPPVTDR